LNTSEIKIFLKSLYSFLENDTLDEFVEFCDYVKLPKGTELIQEGNRHHYIYFVIKGSVKSYYLNEGKESCTWFAFENEIVATIKTFSGLNSNETIKLLEDSEFIRINSKAFKKLAENKMSMSRLINELLIEHAVFLEALLYLKSIPAKDRYNLLVKDQPHLLQRITLTDLASLIGINRETLSRIRSKDSFVTYVK
jgi:CRP-like cAMP-binding protein